MHKVQIKTPAEIKIMHEGGQKLAIVRDTLEKRIVEGISALEIEQLANDLINQSGAEVAFKKVPGYTWATCINVNDGVVHGIPKKETIFKKGDIVSIDVGIYYKGFYTDTSTSVVVGEDKGKQKFLEVGRASLRAGISEAKVGNQIVDISQAIESVLTQAKLTPIEALTGHGVGRELHEAPYIPCFVRGNRGKSLEILEGMVFAIEVMYTQGRPDIMIDRDGWTIRTKDGKISALFEETVAVTANGPFVLTNE